MEASKYADEEEHDEVDLKPKEDESDEEESEDDDDGDDGDDNNLAQMDNNPVEAESEDVEKDPCKLYKLYILFEFKVFHS